jgi:hypothetical protein
LSSWPPRWPGHVFDKATTFQRLQVGLGSFDIHFRLTSYLDQVELLQCADGFPDVLALGFSTDHFQMGWATSGHFAMGFGHYGSLRVGALPV